MALTAFVGRCMFAFVFMASALNKLQTFIDGGEELSAALGMLSPRLDAARDAFASKTGIHLRFLPLGDVHLLAAATFLEGAGAALLILDVTLGAKMLMLFVMLVTPVMHPFWTHEDRSSAAYAVDMIAFFKNVALCGALLTYVAMKAPVAALAASKRGGVKRE